MKFIKLFESYTSQKKLEELTKDILERIAEETYEELPEADSKVRYLESVKLGDFNHLHFKELGTFMQDYDMLSINILFNSDIEGYTMKGGGSYVVDNHKGRYVFCLLNQNTLDKVNDKDTIYRIYRGDRIGMIKYYVYNDYKNVLIHELQHAYDDWRSGGKAVDEPKSFVINKEKDFELMNIGIENLKQDELKFVSDHYKEYHNLKHEVDARFTAAVKKTYFYDLDFDLSDEQNKEVYTIKPFDDVKRSFKSNMVNWRLLKEKEQWRVLRKLGQFYELEKEFVKELNAKQKEFK